MLIFSIKELISRRKPSPPEVFNLPYNLKKETWNSLRVLRSDPAFDSFVETLDEVVKLNTEILLTTNTDENLHFYRGIIQGMRKAATLIDEIQAAQKLHEDQEQKRKDARTTSARARTVATFGTPGWNSTRGP